MNLWIFSSLRLKSSTSALICPFRFAPVGWERGSYFVWWYQEIVVGQKEEVKSTFASLRRETLTCGKNKKTRWWTTGRDLSLLFCQEKNLKTHGFFTITTRRTFGCFPFRQTWRSPALFLFAQSPAYFSFSPSTHLIQTIKLRILIHICIAICLIRKSSNSIQSFDQLIRLLSVLLCYCFIFSYFISEKCWFISYLFIWANI